MLRKGSLGAFSALSLLVSGCGLNPSGDATQGIVKFLGAVRRGDSVAIEAGLDRPALRNNLHDQLAEFGRASSLDVGGGPSEFALDRMITTQSIRRAEAHSRLPAAPTLAEVGPLVRMADKTHACLQDAARKSCSLSFAKRGGRWRLVAMPATEAEAL
ncbi:hypothetical protein [Phenylobacterium sp.]|uniref:hypothetical protein n=1 Tax=Phenylobacterium sp. TaxID=1871053 RepID=UPI00286CF6AF|nr:hypothetical protein [Phenylobacterium sp.]